MTESGEPPGDLQAAKAAIRTQVKSVRDSISANDRAAWGRRIEERLFTLPAVQDARTVLVFYSFGSEVPTRGIIERLLGAGRRVLLPYMEGGDMKAAELRQEDELEATAYGPKEPSHRVPVDPVDLDVVITPGMAFDRSGHRVGYGGGNYDRYLGRLDLNTTRIGIAFHVQVLPEVPHGHDDQPVDFVVTDQETIAR
ncbi:MAG TPA: 5-formyltetrahydrofolate cyclo-ligase [Actinomycetota bacterium]|nr:5-formyltetrahydrofolate cyclo-ligase [Actinomycetota bacterium]